METIHDYNPVWKSSTDQDMNISLEMINAAEFGIKVLMDGIINKPKVLTLNLTEIPLDEDGAKTYGRCHHEFSGDQNWIPGGAEIDLNLDQTLDEMIETLFHEMVHAVQIFKGELKRSRIGKGKEGILVLWKNRAFSRRTMQYADWPWEIEARDVATKVMAQYREHVATAIREEEMGV